MAENAELAYLVAVNSLSSNSQTILSPIEGTISRVTVSWPSGCNFLVEVILNHKRVQFIPTPSQGASVGITMNNFTETLNPNWPVGKNDAIEMVAINHDAANNHSISAIVHITGYDLPESGGRIPKSESKCIRRV